MSFILDLQGLELPEMTEASALPESISFCSSASAIFCG
jgi:hypothetical protein